MKITISMNATRPLFSFLFRLYCVVSYWHILEFLLDGEVLGSENLITLPAYIISNIRKSFPSEDGCYTEFKSPSTNCPRMFHTYFNYMLLLMYRPTVVEKQLFTVLRFCFYGRL